MRRTNPAKAKGQHPHARGHCHHCRRCSCAWRHATYRQESVTVMHHKLPKTDGRHVISSVGLRSLSSQRQDFSRLALHFVTDETRATPAAGRRQLQYFEEVAGRALSWQFPFQADCIDALAMRRKWRRWRPAPRHPLDNALTSTATASTSFDRYLSEAQVY